MKDLDKLHSALSELLDEFGEGDVLTVLSVQISQKASQEFEAKEFTDWDKCKKTKELASSLHGISLNYQYPKRNVYRKVKNLENNG